MVARAVSSWLPVIASWYVHTATETFLALCFSIPPFAGALRAFLHLWGEDVSWQGGSIGLLGASFPPPPAERGTAGSGAPPGLLSAPSQACGSLSVPRNRLNFPKGTSAAPWSCVKVLQIKTWKFRCSGTKNSGFWKVLVWDVVGPVVSHCNGQSREKLSSPCEVILLSGHAGAELTTPLQCTLHKPLGKDEVLSDSPPVLVYTAPVC